MVILVAVSPACNSQLNIAISFGGPAWPISLTDLNLGSVSNGLCLGGIFDITAGSNVKPTPGTPQWIVGDTFLVRIFCYSGLSGMLTGLFSTGQKNVYTVFRSNPPSVGFAQLSSGSSGSQRFFSHPPIIYAWVGIRVVGCSYAPLHVFLPTADPSSPSIQVVLGMFTHRFAI